MAFSVPYVTGKNQVVGELRSAAGQWLRVDTGVLENFNPSNVANYRTALTEVGSTGIYEAAYPSTSVDTSALTAVYRDAEVNRVIAIETPDEPVWVALVSFARDGQGVGGGSADRYGIELTRNGEPVLGTITSPTITVVNASDGSELINAQSLTAISGARYRYTATGAARQEQGKPYFIVVTATVDGVSRTFLSQGTERDR